MRSTHGVMSGFLEISAKLNNQQLRLQSNVSSVSQDMSELQGSIATEMGKRTEAAGAKAKKDIMIGSILSGIGAALGVLGGAGMLGYMAYNPVELVDESIEGSKMAKTGHFILKNAGSISSLLSASSQLFNIPTEVMQYNLAKDKAKISLTSTDSTMATSTNGEMSSVVESAAKLQIALHGVVTSSIEAYKESETTN